jgi:hypothetical protein
MDIAMGRVKAFFGCPLCGGFFVLGHFLGVKEWVYIE